MEALAIAYYH